MRHPPAMETASIRNVGIAAHIDAGKTTLSERILNITGKERRVGRVDEGTAVLDWMDEDAVPLVEEYLRANPKKRKDILGKIAEDHGIQVSK